jgi:hypothetical protein
MRNHNQCNQCLAAELSPPDKSGQRVCNKCGRARAAAPAEPAPAAKRPAKKSAPAAPNKKRTPRRN